MTQTEFTQRAEEGKKIMALKSLSLTNANRLNELGYVAYVYPRKKLVVVNGFMKYALR